MARIHADEIETVSAPTVEQAVIYAQRHHANARVLEIASGGRRYWMKQREQYETFRKRLSKGDASDALRREGRNLQELAQKGIPVPEIVAKAEDYLVVSDCGKTLNDLFLTTEHRGEEVARAFSEAGRALADLHRKGLALGRGKAKDFCWDGERICFIDLEVSPLRFEPATSGRRNLVNFIFYSYFAAFHFGRDIEPELRAFLQGYLEARDADTLATLAAARRWARRRWWLAALSMPVALLRPPRKSPDFRAVAPTLMLLTTHEPPEPAAREKDARQPADMSAAVP
ncbi:MAG: hypothetical protein JJT95_00085 [Pararhodobacter sp.]|nr:hypothetical protein [Pararhodobacter sp.]